MARDLTDAELARDWILTFDEMTLLKTKPLRTHLGFVVQLKVFQSTGRFPDALGDVSPAGVAYLGDQLGCFCYCIKRLVKNDSVKNKDTIK